MASVVCRLQRMGEGQDIAEYAVPWAVSLVIVVGSVGWIGCDANTVFSNAASTLQLLG